MAGVREREVRLRDYRLRQGAGDMPRLAWPAGYRALARGEAPAAFTSSPEATERFFYDVARILHRRVQLLPSLPIEKLSRLKVEKLTRDIGHDRAVKVEEAPGDEPRDSIGGRAG